MKTNFTTSTLTKTPILCLIIILLIFNNFIFAQWPALSTPNVQVTSSAATGGDLNDYWACSDGVGGSYSFFADDRQNPGNAESIYCQRIDRWGNIKFVANGVGIGTIAAAAENRPKATDDGNNNAIVCWQDDRSSPGSADDIYVQKIDSFGTVQWTTNGVLICSAAGKQDKAWIVSDGVGGAIIAWEDARMGGPEDIYAQRVNAAGVPQWTTNGVIICNAPDKQKKIHMIPDGMGGAIIVWEDERNKNVDLGSGKLKKDVYAQRINASGIVQWTSNGVLISNSADDQKEPRIATDGLNGGIITWTDKRNSGTTKDDIYAQKINAAGVLQWTTNGVIVCNAADKQKRPVIASDTYGGAVIAWEDKRTGTEDIYAQRIDSNGTLHWAVNGNVVSNAVDVQKKVDISEANYGKVLLVWEDKRTGKEDIYLQVIDTGGVMLGAANGIAVSTAADVQKKPFVFKSGVTDWIVIWQDDRNKTVTGKTDLYAQGLNPTIIPVLPIKLLSFEANTNGDKVDLKWITTSEINNDYFTVEKSNDAKTWSEVVVINGAGNSNQNIEYYETDYEPLNGISYYRLKQTDFDGKYSYSNIVPVKYESNIVDGNIGLFPSPVNVGGTVHISFNNIVTNKILVVLRDIQGREFYSKVAINIEDGKLIGIPIDANIPAGIYLITATSENQIYSQRLIVK